MRPGGPLDAGRARPLRDLRPHLPLALRAALQLRADLRSPRRVDLLGPLRRRHPLRRARLRPRRPGPRRTPTSSRYAAGHKAMGLYAMWALRDEVARVGRAGAAAGGRAAAPAPRGPARLSPQPDHRDAALRAVRRQGARRAPDAGDAVRQALDRRLRRRRRQLDRPRLRRARPLRRRRARACTSSRARAASRPGRVAEALAAAGTASPRQRRPAPRLEPGVHRQRPRLPRGRRPGRLRAVGPAGALLPARLERGLRPRRARLPADRRRAAAARSRSTTASRRRSSTAPSRAGSTASRARPRTAPDTSSAPTGFYEALAELTGTGAEVVLPTCDAGRAALRAAAREDKAPATVREECFWEALEVVRDAGRGRAARRRRRWPRGFAAARERLDARGRARRARAPRASRPPTSSPPRRDRADPGRAARSQPGSSTTLRGELGRALQHLQRGLRRRLPRRLRRPRSARPA